MKTINLKSGDYEITLLTAEEYEQYKDRIPLVKDWWWLRSPGYSSSYAAFVYFDGSVDYYGDFVYSSFDAIRPALKSDILNLHIGESFIALGNRWVMIDDGVAISQDVITHRRFDLESNDWETSELKSWLTEWAKEGEAAETMKWFIECFDDALKQANVRRFPAKEGE